MTMARYLIFGLIQLSVSAIVVGRTNTIEIEVAMWAEMKGLSLRLIDHR